MPLPRMGREDDISAAKTRCAKFVRAAAHYPCKFLEYFLRAALGLFAVIGTSIILHVLAYKCKLWLHSFRSAWRFS